MVKKILFHALIIAFLSACSQQGLVQERSESADITLEETKAAITEQGLELDKADLPSGNVFIQVLNGVSPKAYFIDGFTLSIYVFPTVELREKAMDDFEEKTDAVLLEQHKIFTVENILVFYVEGSKDNNIKLDKAISTLK